MNEQFIQLAEKLNNLGDLATTVTPQIISQTINYTIVSNSLWTTFWVVCTVACVILFNKFKNNVERDYFDKFLVTLAGVFSCIVTLCFLDELFKVVLYPYAWAFSHFTG